jgi:hypothetical protein
MFYTVLYPNPHTILPPASILSSIMSKLRIRTCICSNRVFDSQKALTIHENSCKAITKRDTARYVPYRAQYRWQKSRHMHSSTPGSNSVHLPNTDLNSNANRANVPGGDLSTVALVSSLIFMYFLSNPWPVV